MKSDNQQNQSNKSTHQDGELVPVSSSSPVPMGSDGAELQSYSDWNPAWQPTTVEIEFGPRTQQVLNRIAGGLEQMLKIQQRLAEALAPEPNAVVDTDYIARKLDCTAVWVSTMARDGQIPKGCIMPGTGNGKPWKFRRESLYIEIASGVRNDSCEIL